MRTDDFVLLTRQPVAALNLTVESYRHPVTGARHLHLACADPHNAFLVAFLTVPEDSSGVAHILEHTSLCGSQRYPVRDPFFMMLRRSLQTFMNAFTSSDWTAYPFASQSRKDFFNLLDVYLDAAFFPRLEALDFAQEGIRAVFEREDDPASPLVFKGVVYNEMKGSLSNPAHALWHTLCSHLFTATTYHHNSGGDPEEIPNLTWAQLREFHARHYHPSNAVFLTYGDIPAAELQGVFQDRVLGRFEAPLSIDFHVPDEPRLEAPRQATAGYPLEPQADGAAKTHVVLGWLLGHSIDLETALRAHLLNGVLLDNSSSPLQLALETTDLGAAPSPLCGLDDSMREMVFIAGLEGSEGERADQVEALVLDALRRVAEEGVEPERVASVLHQLELSRREVGGDGFPYGLKLLMNALLPAIHGADPIPFLDLDAVLERLRQESAEPGFIKGLVRRWLLDNPHRVRLVMAPEANLAAARQAREAARLALLKAAMDEQAQQQAVQLARELDARQRREDDPEVLPTVTLADVPAHLPIPEGETGAAAGLPVTWYDQPTNGLVYQQLVAELPALAEEELDWLPLYTACLTEVGCGGRDYLATQALQAAVSGGVGARAVVRGAVDDPQRHRGVYVVDSKALLRNHQPMDQLMRETFAGARFDELSRLRELVAQMRASAELRITDNGHALAMSAAAAGLSPTAALGERWGGLAAIRRLKELDEALQDEGRLREFADRLTAIGERLVAGPRRLLVVGEERHFGEYRAHLEAGWATLGAGRGGPLFAHPPLQRTTRVGWATATQVHFCAKAYPAVPYSHADAPALLVLGQFLRNGFLHRAVREQGGAYGGGASLDSDAGVFRFYSYRDPRLLETLQDFDHSLEWLASHNHEARTLEEAILGVISAIDKPGSPAGEAKRAFHDALHGRTPTVRRAFRQQVLNTTLADLQRVGAHYLQPAQASIGVVSHAKALEDAAAELGLEVKIL